MRMKKYKVSVIRRGESHPAYNIITSAPTSSDADKYAIDFLVENAYWGVGMTDDEKRKRLRIFSIERLV